jgi:nicotinate-nucleotide adenylyltransferase
MVAAAVADHPHFRVSDLEAQRPGKNYSVDTLAILHRKQPGNSFYFLVGMDSFRDLASWHDYPRLFDLANIVVARRPGAGGESPHDLLPVAIRDQFCYDDQPNFLRHRSGTSLIFMEETFLDISSTRIREILAQSRSIRYLVSAPVADYINLHGLYQPRER